MPIRQSSRASGEPITGVGNQGASAGMRKPSLRQDHSLKNLRAGATAPSADRKEMRASQAAASLEKDAQTTGRGSKANTARRELELRIERSGKAKQHLRAAELKRSAKDEICKESRAEQRASNASSEAAESRQPSLPGSAASETQAAAASQPQKEQSAAQSEDDCDEIELDDELEVQPAVHDVQLASKSCSQEDSKQDLQEHDIDWCGNRRQGSAQAPERMNTKTSQRITRGELLWLRSKRDAF